MEKYEELVKLVNKCRRNLLSVPMKDLKGKYKKSFMNLKRQIAQTAEMILPYLLLSGFYVMPGEDKKAWLLKINSVLDCAKKDGYPLKMGKALTEFCDLELFHAYIEQIQIDLSVMYMPYWLSHTKEVRQSYYNEIINMWYDKDAGLWVNGESFGIYYPPDEKTYQEEIDKRRRVAENLIKEKTKIGIHCA